jgi:DNA replication and repair protein RecF
VLRERPGGIEELLEVYDEQLGALGARLMRARSRYIASVKPAFTKAYRAVSGGTGSPELVYSGAAPGCAPEQREAAAQLMEELRAARARDRARQMTTVGPHTHDIAFYLDGRPTRSFGSQGQLRTLVLAFKIAQITDCYAKRGAYPLLLLDDVSSELDAHRNRYLFDFIRDIPCQTFITTTHPDLVLVQENRSDFRVVSGMIEAAK